MRSAAFVAVLMLTLATGCSDGKAQQEFDRQIQNCSAGELNGVLGAAADACGDALVIAKERNYPSAEISNLSFRLGRIERQRGRFDAAEVLVRASLTFVEKTGDPADEAKRLVELSLVLAGQGRWDEGATLLKRAERSARQLNGGERRAAADAFGGYAARFRKTGDTSIALPFDMLASELAEP